MINQGIVIDKIELAGIRAYLKPKSLKLYGKKKSKKTTHNLAILADNAYGKSSIIDAFEYYLSDNGTIDRLGEKASPTQTGPKALEHVDAKIKGITPKVHIYFRWGDKEFNDSRLIPSPISEYAKLIKSCIKVNPIIRGQELVTFIKAKPEEKYKDLVKWFSLESLYLILKNLERLNKDVKNAADLKARRDERLTDFKHITNNAILDWNEEDVLNWFNTHVLSLLTNPLEFKKISKDDPAFKRLSDLEASEREQHSPVQHRRLSELIVEVVGKPTAQNEDNQGLIFRFERAICEYDKACDMMEDKKATTQ